MALWFPHWLMRTALHKSDIKHKLEKTCGQSRVPALTFWAISLCIPEGRSVQGSKT